MDLAPPTRSPSTATGIAVASSCGIAIHSPTGVTTVDVGDVHDVALAGRYLAWTGDDIVVHDLATGADVVRVTGREIRTALLDEVAVQPDGAVAFSLRRGQASGRLGGAGHARRDPCSTALGASTTCGRRAAVCCMSAEVGRTEQRRVLLLRSLSDGTARRLARFTDRRPRMGNLESRRPIARRGAWRPTGSVDAASSLPEPTSCGAARSLARGCARATSARRRPRSTCSRTARGARRVAALLAEVARGEPRAHIVGVTGPPGAGKSTLLAALARAWRADGRTVAVLAVDPTSKRSGGALLGDRMRIEADPADRGLFIRSTAAGERLGGLAPATRTAAQALAAAFDVVVIETVGVGQSETEVAEAADTVAVVVQPGSGDVLQFLKAGIMEVPDVLVVTKADLGQVAQRARRDLHAALRSLGRARRRRRGGVVAAAGVRDRRPRGRARRAPGHARPARHAGRARGDSARWPTSPPSTASAGCARSAAGARPSRGWPGSTRASTRQRCCARSRPGPPAPPNAAASASAFPAGRLRRR